MGEASAPTIEDDPLLAGITDPKRRALMQRMMAADALPDDGVVQHSGTNANRRRRMQYAILREAWAYLCSGDTALSQAEMATYLNLPAMAGYGEPVLDQMFCWRDAPHNGPVRNPRAAFKATILNAASLESVAAPRPSRELRAPKAAKAAKELKAEPVSAASAPGGQGQSSTPPAATSEAAAEEEFRALCRTRRLDPDNILRVLRGNRPSVTMVEALAWLKRQYGNRME